MQQRFNSCWTVGLSALAVVLLSQPATADEDGSIYRTYFVKACEPALPNISENGAWIGFIGPLSTVPRGRTVGGFTSDAASDIGPVIGNLLMDSGYEVINDVLAHYETPSGTVAEHHDAILVRSDQNPVCAPPGSLVMLVTANGIVDGDESTGAYRGKTGDTSLYRKIEIISTEPPACSFLHRFDRPGAVSSP